MCTAFKQTLYCHLFKKYCKGLSGSCTTFLYNEGSGIGHHFGELALVVILKNSMEKGLYNMFLLELYGADYVSFLLNNVIG